ncbi:MAG: Flp pilus assembly complex ATPase component TadA, partial [Firmicutes bacterium]|nr:Flp pilus assembly complex ATPase component TadA [Bacillota bacterium]
MENIYTDIIKEVHRIAQTQLTAAADLSDDNAKKLISDITFTYIQTHTMDSCLDYRQIQNIIEKIYFKTRSKLNVLKPLIDDKEVSEIMVNGSDKIFYERKGEIYTYKYSFDSEEEVEEVMQAIASQVNREINELNPILDARLPDGSRVNAVYKNVAVTGPTITIRKFLDKAISIEQLVNNGTLTEQAAYLLMAYV